MKNNKKILFVVDVKGWAFYNIANQLKSNLKGKYDCDILAMEDIKNNVIDMFLIGSDYDLIHIFWRGYILDLENDFSKSYIYNLGLSFEYFINNYVLNKKIITCIYDHSLIDTAIINNILKYVSGYYVCSSKLFEIYSKLDIIKKPFAIITDGVDLDLFKPNNSNSCNQDINSELIIGWAGNSKWGNTDNKGLHSLIKPCISKLKNEGYNISLKLADSNIKKIPHKKMPFFYHGIDIYICASEHEGTPNPVLEAMACGKTIISTNVGIVSDVFGIRQSNYILDNRTLECLENKIIDLYKNRDFLNVLSKENLDSIKKFEWKKISLLYADNIKKIV